MGVFSCPFFMTVAQGTTGAGRQNIGRRPDPFQSVSVKWMIPCMYGKCLPDGNHP
ncbi:hypothetical protein HMPREF9141_1048 [Prevotella multiformis DSM 16608]|uniref:Uncharacterized protein n=1 Tax=Prevotella multiformis DSM 16608 TaxID=888743 RepID=F0F631_9BACT|nr:hypothetical protein HMPREF9141_1048 [Prevotella multiformis DSM 16608]